MKKNSGIILKKFSHKQKVILFDHMLGKIDAIYTHQTMASCIHNGSLLSYHHEIKSSEMHAISDIEIHHTPFDLARNDINFLHHVLELSYYFLPLHVAYPETFELLAQTFTTALDNKPMVLLRFFSSLGVYCEDLPFEKNYFHRLLSDPFEIILKEKFSEKQLKMLEIWLSRCKDMHPYRKYFKTNYVITR